MRKSLIQIDTIAHADQRYPSWADWETPNQGGTTLRITVSKIGNWRYEFLSAIHELLEATLCLHQGITQEQVDEFDIPYENARIAGEKLATCGCTITNDPGSDIHAPYRVAHTYAESVEYGLAHLLGVDPVMYDAAYAALDGGVKK